MGKSKSKLVRKLQDVVGDVSTLKGAITGLVYAVLFAGISVGYTAALYGLLIWINPGVTYENIGIFRGIVSVVITFFGVGGVCAIAGSGILTAMMLVIAAYRCLEWSFAKGRNSLAPRFEHSRGNDAPNSSKE